MQAAASLRAAAALPSRPAPRRQAAARAAAPESVRFIDRELNALVWP